MKSIPLKFSPLTLWILLIVSPIPFILLAVNFISGMEQLTLLETQMNRIHLKALQIQQSELRKTSVLASLKNPDPHYLGKHIETLHFQLSEIKKFEMLHAENPNDELITKRLAFLKEGGNRLLFSEDHIRSNELFRETEEKQQRPVEMNEEDLKKLLSLVEGVTIWPYGPKEGRPQLIIKDFKLTRKETSSQEKVFVVSMQLIKRENL